MIQDKIKDLKSYKLVNYCEIDKYASKAYSLIHNINESYNLGDITKVDENKLEDFNFMSFGFPCTDLSSAGDMKGLIDSEGNQTRSGLYYDALRILKANRPNLIMIENVKNLTSKRFLKEFQTILSDLECEGYNVYWKVLNSKNYGIPQHRERLFIIGIKKDIDNEKFDFPKPFELKTKVKDYLEKEVDPRYFISERMKKYIVADNEKWTGNNGKSITNKKIASTINTGEGSRRCDASNYISEDIDDEDVDLKNYLKIKNATKQGYLEAYEGDGIDISSRMHHHRGTVQKGMIQTLDTQATKGVVVKGEK